MNFKFIKILNYGYVSLISNKFSVLLFLWYFSRIDFFKIFFYDFIVLEPVLGYIFLDYSSQFSKFV